MEFNNSKNKLMQAKDKDDFVAFLHKDREKSQPAARRPVLSSDQDADGDWLTDEEEALFGTDPKKTDTDGDGLSDYFEVKVYHCDPNNPDTDGDGICDGEAVKLGNDPRGMGRLKDLFVPHSGNDYRPDVLQPKRLAFYGVSALALKIATIVLVVIMPMEAWLTPDVFAEQEKKIIELTNEVRTDLGIQPLRESQLLRRAAYSKVEDMLYNQYFAHVSPKRQGLVDWLKDAKYNFDVAGENLAMGFTDIYDVVTSWRQSETHYANLIDKDFSEIGVSMAGGDFNGIETTLIAQMFGHPARETAKQIDKPKTRKPVLVQAPERTAVLGDKASTSVSVTPAELAVPVLVAPGNNFMTNKNEIALKLFAPGAESVVILVDGSERGLATGLDQGYKDMTVYVEEGQHLITLRAVAGATVRDSSGYFVNVDQNPPTADLNKTQITVNEPFGEDKKVVQAVAYLSPDAAEAQVKYQGTYFDLAKADDEDNKWVGHTIAYDGPEEKREIIVPTVLKVTDVAGTTNYIDVSWSNITPTKNTFLDQYSFLRKNSNPVVSSIFDITSYFYKALLILASIALAINVFVQIKKQRPKVIASTLGLIALLVVLIIV